MTQMKLPPENPGRFKDTLDLKIGEIGAYAG